MAATGGCQGWQQGESASTWGSLLVACLHTVVLALAVQVQACLLTPLDQTGMLGMLLPALNSDCPPCVHPLLQYYLTDQVDDNCKKGLLLTVTIK